MTSVTHAYIKAQIQLQLSLTGHVGDTLFVRAIKVIPLFNPDGSPKLDSRGNQKTKSIPVEFNYALPITEADISELEALNDNGYSIFYVVMGQGFHIADVSQYPVTYCEIDKEGMSIEEQRQADAAIVPPATLEIFTGGKSLHRYHAFSDAPTFEQWKRQAVDRRNWLLNTGFAVDKSLVKPNQLMRLVGFKHPKTGVRAEIVGGTMQPYSFGEFTALIPQTVEGTKASKYASKWVATKKPVTDTNDIDAIIEALQNAGRLGSRSLDKYVHNAIKSFSEVEEGDGRNIALNKGAFAVGQLVARRRYSPSKAWKAITDAIADWSDPVKDHNTAWSGFTSGVYKYIDDQEQKADESHDTLSKYYSFDDYESLVVNAQRLGENPTVKTALTRSKLLCVKSPKGTGKTFMLIDYLASMEKVAGISHLVSLTTDLAKKQGLSHYKDANAKDSNRLAVCVNSLPNFPIKKGSVVVLDEVSQLLNALCGSALMAENRADVAKAFEKTLREASQVIVMDADLSTIEVDLLAKLTGNTPTVLINDYKYPRHSRKAFVYVKESELNAELLSKVKTGLRIYVAVDSKQKAKDLEALLKPHVSSMLVIHGDNSNEEKQLRFMANPTAESTKYQVIIGSQSVGTGVSIDADTNGKSAFDEVFLYSGDWGGSTALDLAQAAARVRECPTLRIFITSGYQARRFQLVFEATSTHWIEQLREEQTKRHKALVWDTKAVLLDKLESEDGFKVIEQQQVVEGLRVAKVKDDKAERVLNAKQITEDEFKALQIKKAANLPMSSDEKDSMLRFQISRSHGVLELTLSMVQAFLDGGSSKKALFEAVFLDSDEKVKERDERENDRPSFDKTHWVEMWSLMRKIIGLSIKGGTNLQTPKDDGYIGEIGTISFSKQTLIDGGIWDTLNEHEVLVKSLLRCKDFGVDPFPVVKKLFALVGLDLGVAKKVRIEGRQTKVRAITSDSWQTMLDWASATVLPTEAVKSAQCALVAMATNDDERALVEYISKHNLEAPLRLNKTQSALYRTMNDRWLDSVDF